VKSSFQVLAVEDATAYGLLLEHALSSLKASLTLLPTAREAQKYLSGCSHAGTAPDAVLLDLKLLHSTGLDLLRWIRLQPRIQGVPVVVHSGRDDGADVNRAYELGIAAYVAKRAGLRELAMMLSGVLVSQGSSTMP
jgi:two-component system response regulator